MIEWRDVVGYEGVFKVSNAGDIKAVKTNHLLNQTTSKKGYKRVSLQHKTMTVHRIVAQAFIDNPKDLKTVNHIDNNKSNNNVDNLEWMSMKDNLALSSKAPKPVLCIETGIVYPSSRAAGKMFGCSGNHIWEVCNNQRKSAYGYKWRFVDGTI